MNRKQAEDIDPYDYEPDFDRVDDDKKQELAYVVNGSSDLNGDSMSLIIKSMEAQNRIVELQKDLEKLPPQDFSEKWYWFKKGYWFFERPRSWKADIGELEQKILDGADQALTALAQVKYAQNLVDQRKEKVEGAKVSP